MLRKIKAASSEVSLEYQLLVGLVLGILVAAGVGLYGDVQNIGKLLMDFDWRMGIVAMGLAFVNYVVRSGRWQIFLHALGVFIPNMLSWWIFVAGMAMTVTPGRVGELMKSYYLKKFAGAEVSRTAPMLVFERLSDGLAMVLLMSGGLLLTQYGIPAITFALGLAAVFIMILHQETLAERIIDFTTKIPFLDRYHDYLRNFYQSSKTLVQWKPLLSGWGLSIIAWLSESVGLFVVLIGLGVEPSVELLLMAIFIFGFAAIAGFATFLPGGLGVAEGTMVGLLVLLAGLDASVAAAATLLIRLFTLWFGVGWGLVGLVYLQRLMKVKKIT